MANVIRREVEPPADLSRQFCVLHRFLFCSFSEWRTGHFVIQRGCRVARRHSGNSCDRICIELGQISRSSSPEPLSGSFAITETESDASILQKAGILPVCFHLLEPELADGSKIRLVIRIYKQKPGIVETNIRLVLDDPRDKVRTWRAYGRFVIDYPVAFEQGDRIFRVTGIDFARRRRPQRSSTRPVVCAVPFQKGSGLRLRGSPLASCRESRRIDSDAPSVSISST